MFAVGVYKTKIAKCAHIFRAQFAKVVHIVADNKYATKDAISPARSISRRSTRHSGHGRSGSVGSEGEGAERQDSVLANRMHCACMYSYGQIDLS